ncbi:hypothetical protein [Mesorhizobium sp.]|uniref:hypothetical protein n=1 Tax=Mesorhizobium sp. TaxID=1871066 RepID=UPI00120C9F02|nr:hypothetical protein [Mesorhizobium sp.]TIQ79900.1 MAG: hypothetical protein E5X39_12975 [Mesorhizobium sp.]
MFFGLVKWWTGDVASTTPDVAGKKRNLQRLAEAKAILVKEYPDCAPLRQLVGKIDAAVKSLQQWKV